MHSSRAPESLIHAGSERIQTRMMTPQIRRWRILTSDNHQVHPTTNRRRWTPLSTRLQVMLRRWSGRIPRIKTVLLLGSPWQATCPASPRSHRRAVWPSLPCIQRHVAPTIWRSLPLLSGSRQHVGVLRHCRGGPPRSSSHQVHSFLVASSIRKEWVPLPGNRNERIVPHGVPSQVRVISRIHQQVTPKTRWRRAPRIRP